MDFGVLVTSVLSSTVLAGIVSAVVSKSKADKEHSIKNVTRERKVWRDEMRAVTLAVRELYEREPQQRVEGKNSQSSRADESLFLHFNSYGEAKAYLRVRLNPSDCKDQEILKCFEKLESTIFPIDHFERLMASMLKYEWEKAKREINPHGLYSAFSVSAIVCFFLCIFDEYIAIPVTKLFEKMDTSSCVNIGNSGNGNVFYIGKAEYVLSIGQDLLDLLFIGFFFASCVFATYAIISLFSKAFSRSLDEALGFASRHDTLKATFAYCFEIPYRVPDKEPHQAQGAALLAWLMTACIIVMAFAYIMAFIILFFLFLGLFTFLFSFSNYLV